MTAAPAVLAASGLRKSFARGSELVHALDGAGVELRRGELVVLVGRSGSGKSTLLNVLAGWERPDAGLVTWMGTQPFAWASRRAGPRSRPSTRPWEDVAVVPQSLGLIEELSVRANLELPARLGGTLGDDEERVDQLLAHFGLRELAERMPDQTSLGEQQRAALARALVVRPHVVLADEPTGHQDATWATRVISALTVAAGEGTCCLVATHSDEVAAFASRVLRMHDGRIALA